MSSSFDKLTDIMAILRGPKGCPWDHEQTHKSIIPQLIEETYELIDAIESENDPHFCEELGDVLLHIVFHAQMAKDRNAFDINNVIEELSEKLVRRHPHVFGTTEVKDAGEVIVNWDKIKEGESKKHKGAGTVSQSFLDSVPRGLPALFQAQKLSKKASKQGFDWKGSPSQKTEEVLKKVEEEIAELREALKKKKQKNREHEMGDLFFALANLCRALGLQAEETVRQANNRFRKRFGLMEQEITRLRKKPSQLNAKQWDQLWTQAKKSSQ